MSTSFRPDRYVGQDGFALAVLDIPSISPETNISLVDKSYTWEENISSSDSSVVGAYISSDGELPLTVSSDILITNEIVTSSNDMQDAPLYYRHVCRFFHYSYGQNPIKQISILDQSGNVLKGINYKIIATRVSQYVFKIDILTDFINGPYLQYKIRYNKCTIGGTSISPSWVENLNAKPLFIDGNYLTEKWTFLSHGPDIGTGHYHYIVSPTPRLSDIKNLVGISFENAPTSISQNPTNVTEYSSGVAVIYILTATGNNTFNIQRNFTPTGTPSTDYLTSATSNTWGLATNFTTSTGGLPTVITGIPGVTLVVNPDVNLKVNDKAYFTASKSYYYLKSNTDRAIYLSKPWDVGQDGDWYIRVKNGKFARRMDNSGNVVAASGLGTQYIYSIPEYSNQIFDSELLMPYKRISDERASLFDNRTIELQHSPLYFDPSGVLYNPVNPGFLPTGVLTVMVNDVQLPETSIIDWDIENGNIKTAVDLSVRDDISVSYVYKEDYYEYAGFIASGVPYPSGFRELNLNPSPGLAYGVYASGMIASIFLRPTTNADAGSELNTYSLYHNFTGISETEDGYRVGQTDFLLGTVSLGSNCKVSDIDVIDVRLRSGGLSKDGIKNISDVKLIQPESEFFWDVGYFDGQAVPANGALIISIPQGILVSHGGPFEEDEVRRRVNKHVALGEYCIISYV